MLKASLGSFVAAHLLGLGYEVDLQSVAGERKNVIARTAAPPRIVFSTHLDTVPPHIVSSEDAEQIYGRGACDAKGIIAAQISAAENLRGSGLRRSRFAFHGG